MSGCKCDVCGLPYPSLMPGHHGDTVCPACFFHEANRIDQRAQGELISLCEDKGICVYCGEWAEERDHVVPQTWNLPTYTVPSCSDCNRLAGAELFVSLAARRAFVNSAIRRKYRKILRQPDWDRFEISELGTGLRPMVKGFTEAKAVAVSRVRFSEEWS